MKKSAYFLLATVFLIVLALVVINIRAQEDKPTSLPEPPPTPMPAENQKEQNLTIDQTEKPAPTQTPLPGQAIPTSPTKIITEETAGTLTHSYQPPDSVWHTYQEDSFGFSFDYPSNWVIDISSKIEHYTGIETPVTIKNYDANVFTKGHAWSNEAVKIDYVIYPKPPEFTSLKEWGTNYPYLAPETEYSEIQSMKINETEGIRWMAKGPTTPQGIILFAFVKGEQIHQFSYTPATSIHATTAEEIITSFQIPE
jgi:hypothetical protein